MNRTITFHIKFLNYVLFLFCSPKNVNFKNMYKTCTSRESRTSRSQNTPPHTNPPVLRIFRARIHGLHHNEHMLEVTTNVFGAERRCAGFLEDDGHDVVADVSLPQELLSVVWGEGKERRNVEHHLQVSVLGVNAVQSSGVRWGGGKRFRYFGIHYNQHRFI